MLRVWLAQMRFRRELYASLGENRILDTVRLSDAEEIKEMHMGFLEGTKVRPSDRTLDRFPHRVHREYGSTVEAERMGLQELTQFKRRPERGVGVFLGENIPV